MLPFSRAQYVSEIDMLSPGALLNCGKWIVALLKRLAPRRKPAASETMVFFSSLNVTKTIGKDPRGKGRKLTETDFGPGKIDRFTPADFGEHWRQIHAALGYRLNAFAKGLPYGITITSSYRTPAENRAAGGARASKHLTGNAADIQIADPAFFRRLDKYKERARAVGFNGVGIYDPRIFRSPGLQIMHLDIRNKPGAWAGVLELGKRKNVSFSEGVKSFGRNGGSPRVATPGGSRATGALIAAGLFLVSTLGSDSLGG